MAVARSLIKHKQSKHEKTWDDLQHIEDARPPTGSLFNQRPGLFGVFGVQDWDESVFNNCSDVQNPDLHCCVFSFFLSKGPNSQREHMRSHETCPRKTATPVTCGDCRCGPLNPPGRSRGPSMGWFNYARKTLCVCLCVCVCVYVQTCFSSLTWLNRPCRTTPSERPFEAHVTSLCHLSSNFLNRPLKFLGGGNRRRRRAERETNGWCVCVSGVCGGSVVSIYRVWSCFSEAGNPDSIRAGFDLVKMSSLAHSFVCSLHGLYSAKELWKYLTVKQRGRICALSNP